MAVYCAHLVGYQLNLRTYLFWHGHPSVRRTKDNTVQLSICIVTSSEHWPALEWKPNVLDFRLLTVNLPKIVYNEVIDSWYNNFAKTITFTNSRCLPTKKASICWHFSIFCLYSYLQPEWSVWFLSIVACLNDLFNECIT